jgi:riboflavin kinase/FMN adenylyltransferase
LIAEAKAQARARRVPSAAMVFEPHPREFFQPGGLQFRLTTLERKIAIFKRLGLDLVFVEPFDADLAALTGEDFIQRVLVAGLGATHVVIGYDFYFGHKRGGNPELMVRTGEDLGFGVTVMPPIAEDGEVFSSSGIRLHLAQGDVKGAGLMLGEPWRVSGRVVGGARRGTGMGFPTANFPLPKGATLGHGIYAVRVHLDNVAHDGAAYLGTRPTFDDGPPVLEVFLLDFSGDLYGRNIEVEFIDFIRADRRFRSIDELVAQMDRDIAKAREILARA